MYGVHPVEVRAVWSNLKAPLPKYATIKHLFLSLYFQKKYPTDRNRKTKFKANQSTICKWVWVTIFGIQELKAHKIKWPLVHSWTLLFIILVDSTDCPIEEPWRFDKSWFSQQFNEPAVKYKVKIDVHIGSCI